MPFDKFYGHLFDFDTGHSSWMDAAATVEVVGFLMFPSQTLLFAQRKKHRAVGMSCDSDHVSVSGPLYDACFHLVALSDLLSRACWVSKPEDVLEGSPDMAHPEPPEGNECIIDKISLVTVKEKYLFSQHGRFEYLDTRKKIRDEDLNFFECLLQPSFVCHLQVVIPHDKAHPVVFMEEVHLAENVSVGPYDIHQVPVFIQLVTVTEFDVRELTSVIIIQRAREDERIVHEIIGPVPDSSMEIAENNDLRLRCQIEILLVVLECFVQSWFNS
jgi:hypothetical protein